MTTILLGLAGLGLVVLFHEFGHYLAARATGIEVETFSIGWGPKIAGIRKGGTEWQVSAFPIGGFCKMKGEDAFRRAMNEHLEELPRDVGSFYGASASRRIAVALAGPAANIVFAVIVFSIVASLGYTIHTSPAKIIIANNYSLESNTGGADTTGTDVPRGSSAAKANASSPAEEAGIQTGDLIVSISGKPVRDYSDIQEVIANSPGKRIPISLQRDGQRIESTIIPRLDRSSGAGRIGIYAWIDPVIATVETGSAAALAGLESGDSIVAVNSIPVRHSIDIISLLKGKPEKVLVSFSRNGTTKDTRMILSWSEAGESNLGISFRSISRMVRSDNLIDSVADGVKETLNTTLLTLKGIGLLFSGVDVFKAISGPARITWMVGKTVTEGVKQDGAAGLVSVFNFLAFLSVGLFVMNLLPIPALDGGLIIMFIIEIFRKRPLKAKTILRFQFAGSAMIMALFLVATLSDILFFTKL